MTVPAAPHRVAAPAPASPSGTDRWAEADAPGSTLELTASASRLLVLQLRIIAALVAASTLGQVALRVVGPRPGLRFVASFFYVDGEQRLPALYSAGVLTGCALLLGYIGWRQHTVCGRRWWWHALAALLAAAAVDELFAFHERTIDPLRAGLGIEAGLLYHAWIIPGAGVAMMLAAVFWSFLRSLPVDTRWATIVSGAVFLTGALGVEALGGQFVAATDPATAYLDVRYVAITTIEEVLELSGAALFLTTLVRYVGRHLGGGSVVISLGPRRSG